MGLKEEIDTRRQEVRTDAYSVSVGELLSLYASGELDIHPEFQRFFRWTEEQKSRLIESLLIGIPLPSIFVAQREDGVWDVIDGVQRLSTILQFVGTLKDEVKAPVPALVLRGTKYLPSLAGKKWDADENPLDSIGTEHQLLIKRAKIDVKIVLRESSSSTKFELFQRLNTLGSQLTDQELRNCMLVAVNLDAYKWIEALRSYEPFQTCLAVTDRAGLEQYDTELVVRFLVFRKVADESLKKVGDIGEYLTDKLIELGEQVALDPTIKEAETAAFHFTFDTLSKEMADDSFRRWDDEKSKHSGGFLLSIYEVVALGLGFNYEAFRQVDGTPSDVCTKVRSLWGNTTFRSQARSGVRASSRAPVLIPLGRKLFSP